jgi:microcystin-dependent protein
MSQPLYIQSGQGEAVIVPGVGRMIVAVTASPVGGEIGYGPGALWMSYGTGTVYTNTGTAKSASWSPVQVGAASGVPSGSITAFAGSSAPSGWLLCDGSAVSRATYAALFAAIDTTFGAGDGSTTFNLPDARGKNPVGAGSGSLSDTITEALAPPQSLWTVASNTDKWLTGASVVFSASGTAPTGFTSGSTYYVNSDQRHADQAGHQLCASCHWQLAELHLDRLRDVHNHPRANPALARSDGRRGRARAPRHRVAPGHRRRHDFC